MPTNEHDVTIARLSIALALINTVDGELKEAARDYLTRQFSPSPPVQQPTAQQEQVLNGGPKCTKIVPGRTPKIEDALHCWLKLGHEGSCEFR